MVTFISISGFAIFGFLYSVSDDANKFLKERIDKCQEENSQCKVELTTKEITTDKQIYWVGNDSFVVEDCGMRKVRSLKELQELSDKGYK